MKMLFAFGLLLVTASGALALSPEAGEGMEHYPSCHGCHNPELDPPLGPPMFGVQRRYQRAYPTRQLFIENMAAYVRQPVQEKALMKEAVGQLGVMPPLPLPDEMLRKIVSYIYEETFAPPCKHWEIAIRRANEQGDAEHAQKNRRNYDRLCRQ